MLLALYRILHQVLSCHISIKADPDDIPGDVMWVRIVLLIVFKLSPKLLKCLPSDMLGSQQFFLGRFGTCPEETVASGFFLGVKEVKRE
jgi:hypothetical protein